MVPASVDKRVAERGLIEDYFSVRDVGLASDNQYIDVSQVNHNAMAKVAKKSKVCKRTELKIVNPNAAGIDISTREMQVCVPGDRSEEPNRVFGTFTKDLHAIASWLKDCQINTVAMESTGIYWLPLFGVLKDAGFEVLLVDPCQAKNYSGRKTDESDAEWLMLLHSYGLLRSCHQPENMVRKLRNLTRHRDNLIKSASREVLHMQKEMEQMNLKLNNVFSDILGKSGQAIIESILAGERDAEKLASLADKSCKASHEDIVASLQATWDDDHLFIMKQSHELYIYYREMTKKCENEIEILMQKFTAEVDDKKLKELRSHKQKAYRGDVNFDIERYAIGMWGVNVMRIPGINRNAVLRLASELGGDFVAKFETVDRFLSWANLVPNNKISGGKILSSKVPKRKNPVGIIFRQCANALWKASNTMGDYFRHTKARSGHLQAMVATGKKLATIFFTIIQRQQEYDEEVYTKNRKAQLERKIEYTKRKLARLELQVDACI